MWLRSRAGKGHGTPVEAHARAIARYLLKSACKRTVLAKPNDNRKKGDTYHPERAVTSPKPPPIFSSFSIYAPSAAVVANGVMKFAAAMKENTKIRQKTTRARGTFVRMAPRNSMKDISALRA